MNKSDIVFCKNCKHSRKFYDPITFMYGGRYCLHWIRASADESYDSIDGDSIKCFSEYTCADYRWSDADDACNTVGKFYEPQ